MFFVGVVNGIVSLSGATDELLDVENPRVTLRKVGCLHRIHVMDDDVLVKFIAFDPEVATKISSNDIATSYLPLIARVELLVGETLPTERAITHNAIESEVLKPFLKSGKRYELCVGFDHGD